MMRSTILRLSTNARGPASSKALNSFSTVLWSSLSIVMASMGAACARQSRAQAIGVAHR